MTKKKYDDILQPTDRIYRRVRIQKNDGVYVTLIHEKGYMLTIAGRIIGISEVNGKWIATDMFTGLKLVKKGYVKRGYLIHVLKSKVGYYSKMFKLHSALIREQERSLGNLQMLLAFSKEVKIKNAKGNKAGK